MDLKPAHLKRYGNVARLLVKYGNPDPGRAPDALPGDLALPADDDSAALGAELAKDLEALGPTFIELGQLLSSRGALIPPGYADALERLQDSVEPSGPCRAGRTFLLSTSSSARGAIQRNHT
jgi:hypothetical protein